MGTRLEDLPPHVRDRIAKQDVRPSVKPSPLARASDYSPLDDLNKTERRYEAILAERKRSGLIRDYRVQSMTFLLGPHLRYTPDFIVVELDGTLTAIDTKGTFVREDSIVKFKAAADRYPWIRWKMIEYAKGAFTETRVLNDSAT